MPTAEPLEEQLKALTNRLLRAKQKRAEADAEEADVHAQLRTIGAALPISPLAAAPVDPVRAVAAMQDISGSPGSPSVWSLPPLPKGARGQGKRIVALIAERPRVNLGLLTEKVYGANTSDNRASLQSFLSYLVKKDYLVAEGNGAYVAVVNTERTEDEVEP